MKNSKQVIVYYILSKVMFFGLGISFIIGKSKQNSWFAIILGYLIGLIILHFMLKKKLSNLIKSRWGKFIITILVMIVLLNTILSFSVQIINFCLPETPSVIIAFSFLFIILYGASNGIDSFKRLGEIFVMVGLPLTVMGWLGNTPNISLSNFYPLLYGIDGDFWMAVVATVGYSLVPIIIMLCNTYDIDKKSVYIGYTLGGLNILMVIISTIGTLGITLATMYRYPEYIAFKKISIFNIFERMENILALVWLMDLVYSGILCCITFINNFKKIGSILAFLTTMIAIIFFIDIYENTILLYQNSIYLILLLILTIFLSTKKESKS